MAVLASEQQIGADAVIEHAWRGPFAGNHGVETQMTPEVIRQVLRSSLEFPLSSNIKGFRIHDENPSGTLPIGGTQRVQINSIRSAVSSVRPAITGATCDRLRFDDLHDPGPPRIGFRIDNMGSR